MFDDGSRAVGGRGAIGGCFCRGGFGRAPELRRSLVRQFQRVPLRTRFILVSLLVVGSI